jgi:hypothetical protein
MSIVVSDLPLDPDTPLGHLPPESIQHLKAYRLMIDKVEHHAIIALENIGNLLPDWRWHISLKAQGSVPSWRALTLTAHTLRPGVNFVSAVPSEAHWINIHPHVLHLYQINDPGLEAQWRAEGRGDKPS